jgi:hypothetical protein
LGFKLDDVAWEWKDKRIFIVTYHIVSACKYIRVQIGLERKRFLGQIIGISWVRRKMAKRH